METEVSDLQDETRIDDAVGGLEVTVALHLRGVKVRHAAYDVVYQGSSEHAIELYLLVLQYVLPNISEILNSGYRRRIGYRTTLHLSNSFYKRKASLKRVRLLEVRFQVRYNAQWQW